MTVNKLTYLEVFRANSAFEIDLLRLTVDMHEEFVSVRQAAINQLSLEIKLYLKVVLEFL